MRDRPKRRLVLPCVPEDTDSLLRFLTHTGERMETTVLLPRALATGVGALGPSVQTETYVGSPRLTTTFDECCVFRDALALRSSRLAFVALASGAQRFRILSPVGHAVCDRRQMRVAVLRSVLAKPLRPFGRALQRTLNRVWVGMLDARCYTLLARMLGARTPAAARPESIHFVVASLSLGGTQQQLVRLIRELVSRGYRCKVWLLVPGDATFTRALTDAGGESGDIWGAAGLAGAILFGFWRACSWRSHVPVAIALGIALGRDRPTVLQSLLDVTNVSAALAGRLARVPIVVAGLRSVHPRDRNDPIEDLHRRCYDLLQPALVDAVIANSETGAASFGRHHPGALARKLHVVPNGVRTDAPPGDPDPKLWHDLGLRPATPLVAWVGRLSPEKRLDVFLRACRALSDVEFHAVVVGDGRQREEVHHLCRELGLAARVSFLGFRRDALQIMRAAHVVALSSDFEGFPNALLEAQAIGRPVIGTRAGGTIELIEDGVTGFLVEPGDADAMADRLGQLLRHPDVARRMGDAGAARVRRLFTTAQLADRTLDVYRRAAVAKGVALRPRES